MTLGFSYLGQSVFYQSEITLSLILLPLKLLGASPWSWKGWGAGPSFLAGARMCHQDCCGAARATQHLPVQRGGLRPGQILPGAEMKKCLSTSCLRQFLLINIRIFLMPFFKKDFLRSAVTTASSLWLSQLLTASFLLLDLFGQKNPRLSIPVAPSSAVCETVPW